MSWGNALCLFSWSNHERPLVLAQRLDGQERCFMMRNAMTTAAVAVTKGLKERRLRGLRQSTIFPRVASCATPRNSEDGDTDSQPNDANPRRTWWRRKSIPGLSAGGSRCTSVSGLDLVQRGLGSLYRDQSLSELSCFHLRDDLSL